MSNLEIAALKALKELDEMPIEKLIKRIENNMEKSLALTIRELNGCYLCL